MVAVDNAVFDTQAVAVETFAFGHAANVLVLVAAYTQAPPLAVTSVTVGGDPATLQDTIGVFSIWYIYRTLAAIENVVVTSAGITSHGTIAVRLPVTGRTKNPSSNVSYWQLFSTIRARPIRTLTVCISICGHSIKHP